MDKQQFDATDYEKYRINQREQRLFVQKKTFTKWMNSFLLKANMEVEDIFVDLSDGRKLLKLLEIISGERLGKPTSGQMRIHKLENVNKCLRFLADNNMKMENISAEDIVDGNQKLILGLLWSIILRFHIKEIEVHIDDEEETGAHVDQEEPKKHSMKEALVLWCQKRIKGYRNVNVTDFGPSWRDGMAFNALIHSHRPDLVDYDLLNPDNHIKNLNSAFEIAREHLEIEPLLDAEDVDTEKPDEPSIMTYVSSFYHTMANSSQPEPPKVQLKEEAVEETTVQEKSVSPQQRSVAPPSADQVDGSEQQQDSNFFLWVIVVAVGYTILRNVFYNTTRWFSEDSLDH